MLHAAHSGNLVERFSHREAGPDPITNGHMWVIQEARAILDEVVIFISENPFKKPQLASEQHRAIVEQCVAARGWSNVSVVLGQLHIYQGSARRQPDLKYMAQRALVNLHPRPTAP